MPLRTLFHLSVAFVSLLALGFATSRGSEGGAALALGCFFANLFVASAVRHFRREAERAAVLRETTIEPTASSPPEGDPKRSQLSPRDQRLVDLRERDKTGLCRYCDAPAKRQVPRTQPITHLLDALYRRLNVLPVHQYRLEMEAPLDEGVPEVLCDMHQGIARGHVEAEIADDLRDCANFAEKRRARMLEFHMHALDERMKADADAMRQKKTPKKAAAVERPVTQLRAVNGGNG